MSDVIMNTKTVAFKFPGAVLVDPPSKVLNDKQTKSKIKTFEEISELLSRLIEQNEEVLALVSAAEKIKIWEAVITLCYAYTVKKVVLVFTDRRLIEISTGGPLLSGNRIRIVRYSAIKDIRCSAGIWKSLDVKCRDNLALSYENLSKADIEDIAGRLKNRILSAPRSIQNGNVKFAYHVCPDCLSLLREGVFNCQACGKKFKDDKKLLQDSLLIPGGAYIKTGFFRAGIAGLFTELFFMGGAVFYIYEISLRGMSYMPFALFYLFLLASTKTLSYFFCLKQIRSFIPEKDKTGQQLR